MAATLFYQPPGFHCQAIYVSSLRKFGNFPLRLPLRRYPCNAGIFKEESCTFIHRNLPIVLASSSHVPELDHSSVSSAVDISHDSETESTLVLMRHGESLWNERNLFTGSVDVPLTKRGVEEAIQAGKRISYIPVDIIYTSSLIRAQMTAMLAMTQHCQRKGKKEGSLWPTSKEKKKEFSLQTRDVKVPIFVHNESEQAKTWTKIYSEETKKLSIPVITAWQLNERMYGELQGLNKQETAKRYGKEQVLEWRRSFDIPPPNGESLEMCSKRAVTYFKDYIEPQLEKGKNVMVAAHGNSLRSIIMYLARLTSQEVINLELSTGIPLLYIYKDGNFISRGSPVGPTEAGKGLCPFGIRGIGDIGIWQQSVVQ